MHMFNLPMNQVGPPWAGNQLVNCVTELVTACEDRAQELGYEDLARPLGCYDPGHEDIFDQSLQATVTGLRASIRQALQSSWGPEQVQGSPADNLMMFDGGDEDPTFSAAPTAGQQVAWQKFKSNLQDHYQARIVPVFQQGLPGF